MLVPLEPQPPTLPTLEPELCGYRFRLDPTGEQSQTFMQIVGSCRYVWNWFRQQRISVYAATKDIRWDPPEMIINKHDEVVPAPFEHTVNYFSQANQLKPLKKHLPWLKVVPAQALQQVLVDLEKAFTNFYSGDGFPKPKRKEDTLQSFRYPQGAQLGVHGKHVFLPNIGWVKFFKSQEIPAEIKSATISFDQDHWYISFCCVRPKVAHTFPKEEISIDVGVKNPLTDEHGKVYTLPVKTRAERRRLRYLQRQVDKKTGTKNRAKAQKKFRKANRKIIRRINDARHKLTTDLAKNHRQVNIEDLRVKNMTASAKGTVEAPGKNVKQKSGLNRAMLEIGFGEIRRQLEYKCQRYGGRCVAVPPKNTSRECPLCHHTAKANRVTRDLFCCQKCKFTAPADQVGAMNVKQRAGGLPVLACPVAKPRHRRFRKRESEPDTTLKQEPVTAAMRPPQDTGGISVL